MTALLERPKLWEPPQVSLLRVTKWDELLREPEAWAEIPEWCLAVDGDYEWDWDIRTVLPYLLAPTLQNPGILPGLGGSVGLLNPPDVRIFLPLQGSFGLAAGVGGTTNNTYWTRQYGARWVKVILLGMGGGAGSGRKGSTITVCTGGGGGGGGGFVWAEYLASDLPPQVPVVVPAGAPGGLGISAADTNGNAGGSGTYTLFGSFAFGSAYLAAMYGGNGSGGLNGAAAGGAGASGAGQMIASSSNTGNGSASSATGGAGGGGSPGMGPGGGSGAGLTSGNAHSAGGSGGRITTAAALTLPVGGAAGGGNGPNGTNYNNATGSPTPGLAGGGGGSANSGDAVSGGNGGNGGDPIAAVISW